MDIGNSILVHIEFERGKSMADNGGPVRVILNRRSLGFTSVQLKDIKKCQIRNASFFFFSCPLNLPRL